MANKAVKFGRATEGADYALMEDGPTAEGQSTLVPLHAIYGYLPDTISSDLAGSHSGIDLIQAQIGATANPATGTTNKLLTDILAKYGIGLPSAFGSGGGLKVDIVSGAGSGGTASTDDADFTPLATSGTPAMGVYEATPTSVTNGDMGIVAITVDRRQKVSALIDTALPTGSNAIGKLAANDNAIDIGDVTINNAINAGVYVRPGTGVNLDTGAVTVAVSALPSGAATSANQALGLITTETEYNITLTSINQQFSQALPATCKGFEFVSRGGYPVRWSLVTGKVATPTAPYNILKAGSSYDKSGLNLSSATIYFATAANAGDVVELIAWS